jgi:hypothetical protein
MSTKTQKSAMKISLFISFSLLSNIVFRIDVVFKANADSCLAVEAPEPFLIRAP